MVNTDDKFSKIYNCAKRIGSYFIDSNGQKYCFLDDGYTVLNIEGNRYAMVLSKQYTSHYNEFIKNDDIKSMSNYLSSLCEEKSIDYRITQRCNFYDNTIYIDLHGKEPCIISISSKEIICYESFNIPLLVSNNNTLALPMFNEEAMIEDYTRLINKYFYLNKDQKLLLSVFIVSLFIEHLQSPLLLISGSKGSGKSMYLNFIKRLIDPAKEKISLFPSSNRDLAIMLDNSYLCAYDNLSENTITAKASDMLCVAITGGTMSTRKLYSDNELSFKYLKNKVIMNGIGSIASKPDLLDRSMLLEVKRIPDKKRKSATLLDEDFEKDIPTFLGSIFKILMNMLDIIDTIQIDSISRLTDFCTYGYAIAETMETGLGKKFLQCYKSNINDLNIVALEENVVARCILYIMDDKKELVLSMGDLYKKICIKAEQLEISKRGNIFPGSPSVLSSRLEEIKSNLEEIGIKYSKKNIGKCKEVTIVNTNYKNDND